MPVGEQGNGPFRVTLNSSELNATLRDTLISNTSMKIRPFCGGPTVYEWLREYEVMTQTSDWDEATKLKKFPMFLREGAAGWYEEIQARNLTW